MTDTKKSLDAFPENKRLPSLFSEKLGVYDSQVADVDDNFGGEYRGFYRLNGKDRWVPKKSTNNGRTGGKHKGIDIYAPFYPFPKETPVLAPFRGRLKIRSDINDSNEPGGSSIHSVLKNLKKIDKKKQYKTYIKSIQEFSKYLDRGDGLGNRAEIWTTLNKKNLRVSLGHLSRFNGRDKVRKGRVFVDRIIEKGELIGYAGCTGNADTAGECSAAGQCHVNSGHVHVQTDIAGKWPDPEELFDWKLRFKDETRELDCAAWLAEPEPRKLTEPKQRPGNNGKLALEPRPQQRKRKNGLRDPLPKPFDDLEFDSTRSLSSTEKAYREIESRFPTEAEDTSGNHTKNTLQSDAAVEAMATMGEDLIPLCESIDREFSNARDFLGEREEIGGPLLRALILINQALWIAFGGKALRRLNSSRARGIGDKGAQPVIDSGVGVRGDTWCLAIDGGRCSLHAAGIERQNGAGAARTVISVSFGGGSFQHATWSEELLGEYDEPDSWQMNFVRDVFGSAVRTWFLHDMIFTQFSTLNQSDNELQNDAVRNLLEVITSLWTRPGPDDGEGIREMLIRAASHAEAVTFESNAKRLEIKSFLKKTCELNGAIFEDAKEISKPPEGNRPIGPNIKCLQLAEDRNTEEEGGES